MGAIFSLFMKYPNKLRSYIAASGSGIYLAVIAFSLVSESKREGNGVTMGIGFIVGAVVVSFFNHELLKKFNLKKEIQKNNDNKEIIKNNVKCHK